GRGRARRGAGREAGKRSSETYGRASGSGKGGSLAAAVGRGEVGGSWRLSGHGAPGGRGLPVRPCRRDPRADEVGVGEVEVGEGLDEVAPGLEEREARVRDLELRRDALVVLERGEGIDALGLVHRPLPRGDEQAGALLLAARLLELELDGLAELRELVFGPAQLDPGLLDVGRAPEAAEDGDLDADADGEVRPPLAAEV